MIPDDEIAAVERDARAWLKQHVTDAPSWRGAASPGQLITRLLNTLENLDQMRREVWKNPAVWMRWCDERMLARNEDLVVALDKARRLAQPVTDEPNQDWD